MLCTSEQPSANVRTAHKKREDIIRETERRLDELKQLDGEPHTKAACALRSHPVYVRYIRQTKGGTLKLNRAKVRSEAHFDGKSLISTSDDTLSAEDTVMGYKQLAEIERVFRDLKHTIDIRPVFHRLPDRIRAHVLLCWLAMLLIRIAEQETHQTRQSILTTLQPLQMGIYRTASGEVWQTSPITKAQHGLFTKLSLKLPPKYHNLPTPRSCRNSNTAVFYMYPSNGVATPFPASTCDYRPFKTSWWLPDHFAGSARQHCRVDAHLAPDP